MLKAYLAVQDKVAAAKDHMAELKRRLAEDNDGAALVEYSILIGLITVAAIAAILFVGKWVANQWSSLEAKLP